MQPQDADSRHTNRPTPSASGDYTETILLMVVSLIAALRLENEVQPTRLINIQYSGNKKGD
jgi:hypothetical protein